LLIGLTVAGLMAVSVQIAFFTALTALMERTLPYPLPVHQSANIIAHAVTPAAIVFTVYAALPLQGLNLWVIYLIAYSIFLVGGTTACRSPRPRSEQ
jgi:hypothetical protein